MPRYHINNKGEAGLCFARKNCPFGDLERDHYSDKNEAILAFESKNQDQMFQTFKRGKDPLNYVKVRDILSGEYVIIPKVERLASLGQNKNLEAFSEIFMLSGLAAVRSKENDILEDLDFIRKHLSGKDLEEFEKQTGSLDYSKAENKEKLRTILLHFSEDIRKELPFGFTYSNGRKSDAFRKVSRKNKGVKK